MTFSSLDSIELVTLTKKFLAAYEAKQLDEITKMFAPDISLRDWNYEVNGLAAATAEYEKNFRHSTSLEITIKQILTGQNTAAAELTVLVNNEIHLNVVDVLTFDEAGLITSIFAYKST